MGLKLWFMRLMWNLDFWMVKRKLKRAGRLKDYERYLDRLEARKRANIDQYTDEMAEYYGEK